MKNLFFIFGLAALLTACGGGGEGGGTDGGADGGAGAEGTNAAPEEAKVTIHDLYDEAVAAFKECDTNKLAEVFVKATEIEKDLLDAVNKKGMPLIHEAVSTTCIDVVKMLHKKQVKWDIMDMRGRYPIHKAALSSNLAMMEYLASIGQDLNQKTKDGVSVLDNARNNYI
ncbi:MAG: ankyrin repeat domain-containing protein, partial [Verrucomicrobiota bacterium]